ncbi:hypothetical protein [Streptomyces sp. XHT-2]|uniref:hypothetical protein n=1 Tax=Streptomyces sp. XHT-2 TaxID=2692621 RepID=UPI0013687A09|nr:hypothetical protein [Streptomyces sp. XHT-2]WSB46869.1 hypothetical protein OHA00_05785 [Streptomyces cellulosae]
MAAEQLPEDIREFTDHLRDLLARLDRYAGWCLVFWQRDPDGMRACLEGREPPPWDVMESLLQDLAAVHGPAAAVAELPRSRALHAGATAAFDARPGARQALSDRLDVMLREQRYAADRRAGLTRRLAAAATREEAESLGNDLAWAEDDHRRATARCAEITARMAALDEHTPGPGPAHTQTRWAASPAADAQAVAGPQGPYMTSAGQSTGPNPAPDGRGITESPGPARTPGVPQVGPARQGHGPAPDRRPAGGGPCPARDGRGPAQAPGAPQAGPGHDETAYLHGRSPEPSHRRPGPENPAATGRNPLAAPEPHVPSHSHPLPPDPVPPELRAAQQHVPPPAPAEETRPSPPRKRRRGGARFAGVEEDGAAPLVAPSAAVPELPVAATVARGARFAGAAAEAGAGEPPPEERVDAEDLREVGHLVRTLTRLRREGRSGDAHVLLNEAVYWPAVRLPLLAAEMERAGLGADWATLLWEAAATLPAERLVGAADALAAGGRAEDGEQILRQGVVRPADEIGHAALALADGTRHRELRALLDACVRTRTPQDAARTAAPDPGRLVPLLLTAARAVSEERHWDVLHALRVAGLAA